MQVDNIQSSQNFGMALKINKGAKKALENCSMETIQRLQKAGEDLKDTKFYHVAVGDDLSAKITADKDAYFGLFKTKEFSATKHGETKKDGKLVTDNRIIMINHNDRGAIAGVGRYVPYGETKPFFDAWGYAGAYNSVEEIGELAKIAKILDDAAVAKYGEQAANKAAETAEKVEVAKAVGNLLDTFGE